MFSYISAEWPVPSDRPLLVICGMTDAALKKVGPTLGGHLRRAGCAPIAPVRLLRADAGADTARWERLLMELLGYNYCSAGS